MISRPILASIPVFPVISSVAYILSSPIITIFRSGSGPLQVATGQKRAKILSMNTYQPWTVNLISLIQHNAACIVWLTQRLSHQYHSQSNFSCVTAVVICLALAQLLDQTCQLLHLIGKTTFLSEVLKFIIYFRDWSDSQSYFRSTNHGCYP